MKKVILNIITFIICLALAIWFYLPIFQNNTIIAVAIMSLILIYGAAMSVSGYGMWKIKYYEIKAVHKGLSEKERKNILFYSVLTLCPTYYCLVLSSIFPMIGYEIWFLTVFPCLIIISLPIKTVAEEYYHFTHKKWLFLTVNLIIIVLVQIVGQVVIRQFF